jgi:hypothetical protein
VNQTLGLVFSLDLHRKTSRLLKNLYDPEETLYAQSQGAFNLLPNGNGLMGYGQLPVIKEYGPRGDVRLSIQFGDLVGLQSSYRAFRVEWDGVPAAAPVVVAEPGRAYVSWNGATGVVAWEIYEGKNAHSLKYTKTVKNTGFETEASLLNSTTAVKVAAVMARSGKRTSAVALVSVS